MDAVVALALRLRAAAAELHLDSELTAARRGVLESLQQYGDQTVPEIARARPASRQHVQSLVNGLLADALVERVDNPAHRRSKRMRITAGGRALLDGLHRREAEALKALAPGLDPWRLREATQVLAELRTALESERWQAVVRQAG